MVTALTYYIVSIACMLGLGAGWALAKIAPEELKDGKKYFTLIQRLLVIIILGTIMYFYKAHPLWIIGALFLMSNIMFKYDVKMPYIYFGYGIIFWLSAKEQNWFLLESSLIFLCGVVTGSLLEYKKDMKQCMLTTVFFICWILYFI